MAEPPRFDPHPPELSRPVAVERVGPAGLDVEIRADAAECHALAARMAIPAVEDFVCRFRLAAAPGRVVLAEGHLQARVVRVCVLTLDPFETVTEERFRLRFVPSCREPDDDDPDSDDEIAYQGGTIELGEAAAEQLALALDPYPRKPGAVLPDTGDAAAGHPFAALARLPRPR
jgi:uncharacterized metal-binding protein YceD (DUF177 family)